MKSQLYFSLFMTMKFGKHSSCIQDSFPNDNLAFFLPARGVQGVLCRRVALNFLSCYEGESMYNFSPLAFSDIKVFI